MRLRFYHWWALDLFHKIWGPIYRSRPELALLHGQMLVLAALVNPNLPNDSLEEPLEESTEDESPQSSQ